MSGAKEVQVTEAHEATARELYPFPAGVVAGSLAAIDWGVRKDRLARALAEASAAAARDMRERAALAAENLEPGYLDAPGEEGDTYAGFDRGIREAADAIRA